jgi:hypothetical protein
MSLTIDNTNGFTDNGNQNEQNDNDERIFELDNATPINNPDCEHHFVKDDDMIGDYQSWICQSCKRGVYIHKDTKIINS